MGADLYALTKILFRRLTQNLPCNDKKKWELMSVIPIIFQTPSLPGGSAFADPCTCTLALALLEWPICTFCTVFKLQALMSWWKVLQSASHCTGAGAENLKRKDKALQEPARSGEKYTCTIHNYMDSGVR